MWGFEIRKSFFDIKTSNFELCVDRTSFSNCVGGGEEGKEVGVAMFRQKLRRQTMKDLQIKRKIGMMEIEKFRNRLDAFWI